MFLHVHPDRRIWPCTYSLMRWCRCWLVNKSILHRPHLKWYTTHCSFTIFCFGSFVLSIFSTFVLVKTGCRLIMDYVGFVKLTRATRGWEGRSPLCHIKNTVDVTAGLKLRANGRKISQHCWANNVGSRRVRLHVAKSLTGFKLCATTALSLCPFLFFHNKSNFILKVFLCLLLFLWSST